MFKNLSQNHFLRPLKARRLPSIWLSLLLLLLSSDLFSQSVNIQKTTVSGCYYYGGQSMTTVSVQVSWSGANSNDIITVQLDGGATRTINCEDFYDPGTGSAVAGPIISPQVVAFEFPANGGSHSIRL